MFQTQKYLHEQHYMRYGLAKGVSVVFEKPLESFDHFPIGKMIEIIVSWEWSRRASSLERCVYHGLVYPRYSREVPVPEPRVPYGEPLSRKGDFRKCRVRTKGSES